MNCSKNIMQKLSVIHLHLENDLNRKAKLLFPVFVYRIFLTIDREVAKQKFTFFIFFDDI